MYDINNYKSKQLAIWSYSEHGCVFLSEMCNTHHFLFFFQFKLCSSQRRQLTLPMLTHVIVWTELSDGDGQNLDV